MRILVVLILAALFAFLFSLGRNQRTAGPLLIFFFVLFFAGIAGQLWVVPLGPRIWGVAWIPTVFVILIVALLFLAPSPHQEATNNPPKQNEKADEATSAVVAVGLFIWFAFCVLAMAILLGLYLLKY
jgi:hypothetical protein